MRFYMCIVISIHTPAKGVTTGIRRRSCSQKYFNPHSREGSDDPSFTFKISLMISIHTPAKGVTPELTQDDIYNNGFQSTLPRREWLKAMENTHRRNNFNPHSREGSDAGGVKVLFSTTRFQSTLPRREWRASRVGTLTTDAFQSTLPRREWQYKIEKEGL